METPYFHLRAGRGHAAPNASGIHRPRSDNRSPLQRAAAGLFTIVALRGQRQQDDR